MRRCPGPIVLLAPFFLPLIVPALLSRGQGAEGHARPLVGPSGSLEASGGGDGASFRLERIVVRDLGKLPFGFRYDGDNERPKGQADQDVGKRLIARECGRNGEHGGPEGKLLHGGSSKDIIPV